MQKNNPILINIPHSSTYIPNVEKKYFVTRNLKHEIDVMTDHFCDELFNVGNEMIRFPVSRLICDPERFRNDSEEIMSKVGMGAIYTSCSDGNVLKRIPDVHKRNLLFFYYDTYHKKLESAVDWKLDKHGCCLIIDGHSFYDEPLPYEPNQDPKKPDICIGTDKYHTPESLSNLLFDLFYSKNYSVAINRPYSGSIVPMKHYRKDKRVMSVMIEINRGLYIDHEINKTDGFPRVKKDLAEIIGLLEEYRP